MNKTKIIAMLLSVGLIVSIIFSVYMYGQVNEKNSEIEAKDSALQSALLELQQKDSEIASKNSELETKNSEIATKNSEIDSLNSEIESLDAEIVDLRKPKVRWEISYTDHREELALPGYQLRVTGTITNYGVTDIYNVKLQVLAYYVNGEIAVNKTEPPGGTNEFPIIKAGTTYEVWRWVYYDPGLIDTVTITPIWEPAS